MSGKEGRKEYARMSWSQLHGRKALWLGNGFGLRVAVAVKAIVPYLTIVFLARLPVLFITPAQPAPISP